MEENRGFVFLFGLYIEPNLSLFSEFDSVTKEIDKDLSQSGRIAHQSRGDLGTDIAGEFKTCLFSLDRNGLSGTLYRGVQVKIDLFQLHFL